MGTQVLIANTVKALLSRQGDYLFFAVLQGGLKERGRIREGEPINNSS